MIERSFLTNFMARNPFQELLFHFEVIFSKKPNMAASSHIGKLFNTYFESVVAHEGSIPTNFMMKNPILKWC
jgi:hypothetical protein